MLPVDGAAEQGRGFGARWGGIGLHGAVGSDGVLRPSMGGVRSVRAGDAGVSGAYGVRGQPRTHPSGAPVRGCAWLRVGALGLLPGLRAGEFVWAGRGGGCSGRERGCSERGG